MMKAYAIHEMEHSAPVHTVVYGYSVYSVVEHFMYALRNGRTNILYDDKSGSAGSKRLKKHLKQWGKKNSTELLELFNQHLSGGFLEEQEDARLPVCYGWTAADFVV